MLIQKIRYGLIASARADSARTPDNLHSRSGPAQRKYFPPRRPLTRIDE